MILEVFFNLNDCDSVNGFIACKSRKSDATLSLLYVGTQGLETDCLPGLDLGAEHRAPESLSTVFLAQSHSAR